MTTFQGVRAVTLVVLAALVAGCASNSTHRKPGHDGSEGTAASAETGIVDTMVVPTQDIRGEDAEDAAHESVSEQPIPEPEDEMSYRIGPGDVLFFRSFDDDQLSMSVPVRYDGHISLQVVPDLKVEGLTRKEAEDLAREAYSEYFVEPELSLSVAEVRSKIFTVMGEVSQPSEYDYTRPITLLNAINIAGGIRVNQRGGDSYVGAQGQLVQALVIRHIGDERHVFEVDMRDFEQPGPSPADTPIYPGDVVYVPESANLVYLLGEVRQPRVYAISQGLTLIRLLALAGGFEESRAHISKVAITREISKTETKILIFDVKKGLKTGADMMLEPGDIIYVPRRPLVRAQEFLQRVVAPATTGMSFARQVLGLYQQAYSAYYTKQRYDLLYNNNNDSDNRATALYESTLFLQDYVNNLFQLTPRINGTQTP